ncbi:hypothetical protein MBAV_005661 [Candidatus Magnetobacterium bavaricum]|uniref:Uncharacterized protein n=1 Tax=Candidatus Magnetobacterium bavaricum TaxID=29290 RepID=A0A0F3GJS7_9BACT|nr:hypothetical protein MBAV_005661 [Candidatus Magnetobacterium bavaricum]
MNLQNGFLQGFYCANKKHFSQCFYISLLIYQQLISIFTENCCAHMDMVVHKLS